MELVLNDQVRHILLLGAGASTDYGLPTWSQLSDLIKEKIAGDSQDTYRYKDEILAWIEKVGPEKYATIDECISKESISKEYRSNGHEIEDQIFFIIKDIFNERSVENEEGWIRLLNEIILRKQATQLEDKIAFVNFNYDQVLEQNYLNYQHLSEKERRITFRQRLASVGNSKAEALYAHGNLYGRGEFPAQTNIIRYLNTVKTESVEFIDVVSCYDSGKHYLHTPNTAIGLNLYLLGLGGGLSINLNNIYIPNPIREIHVTVHNPSNRDSVVDFLSKKYHKQPDEIKMYSDCSELVTKAF